MEISDFYFGTKWKSEISILVQNGNFWFLFWYKMEICDFYFGTKWKFL